MVLFSLKLLHGMTQAWSSHSRNDCKHKVRDFISEAVHLQLGFPCSCSDHKLITFNERYLESIC